MGLPTPFVDELSGQAMIQSWSCTGSASNYSLVNNCGRFENSGGLANENSECTKESSPLAAYTDVMPCVDSKMTQILEVSENEQEKKIEFENMQCTSGSRATNPVTRIIGFNSPTVGVTPKENENHDRMQVQTPGGVLADISDLPFTQARKRTLSPLSDMLSSAHGSILSRFVETEEQESSKCAENDDLNARKFNYGRHDYKKANCSPLPSSTPFHIPNSYGSEYQSVTADSVFQTDGPLLERADEKQLQNDFCKKVSVGKVGTVRCSKSPPLHSLSPLGPKWSARMAAYHNDSSRHEDTDSVWCPQAKNLDAKNNNYQISTRSFVEDEAVNSGNTSQRLGHFHRDITPVTVSGLGMQWSHNYGSAPPRGIKLSRNFNGLPTRRSLVGSFEESLLSGRFSFGRASQTIEGFLAVLSVTGGNFSPPSRKIPFSVTCVDADSTQLYFASVDLAGSLPQNKTKGSRGKHEESRAAKSRFRIPVKGRVQLVLSNPEMTPVHTFLCNYDLTDMPPGTKTFMRHKVTLAANGGHRALPKDISANKSSFLSEDEHSEDLQFNDGLIDHNVVENRCCTDLRKFRDSTKCSEQNSGILCGKFSDAKQLSERNHILKSIQESENLNGSLSYCHQKGTLKANFSPDDICDKSNIKDGFRLRKGNNNITVSGVLRYALHLRFLCPSPKKSSKRSVKHKSDSSLNSAMSSDSMNAEDQRHFYLYNDLRVVFPQRQSDADEGKLQVEYHFPEDPKYFEYS